MTFKSTILFISRNLEAIIWLTVLLIFLLSPIPTADHLVICPFRLAGFQHCPGCGLGTALIMLLHGHIADSIAMHPLALFALPLLIGRIYIVFLTNNKLQKLHQ